MFYKISVLENFAKFTGKWHVHEELFTFLRKAANPVSVKLLSIS